MAEKLVLSEAEWQEKLDPEAYSVLRQKGTERPGTGKFYQNKADGTYICGGCGAELFQSEAKFDSGSGWPSFWEASTENVAEIRDVSHGMSRTEVTCSKCDGHLGHVFPDGYGTPSGQRYCINSLALNFVAKS